MQINGDILNDIIVGYVPHRIYAFSTPQAESYLKVGETGRSVLVRLNEWQRKISDLQLEKEWLAMLPKSAEEQHHFFQDHALHQYFFLKGFHNLPSDLAPGNSNEFFDVSLEHIEKGIDVLNNDFLSEPPHVYSFFRIEDHAKQEQHWARTKDFSLRKNQAEVVDKIKAAASDSGITPNFLLFAVMRFGKTFVALEAAKEIGAKLTVVVSAKADVEKEWQENLESHKDFEGYKFLNGSSLRASKTAIGDALSSSKVVLFLTLQDLKGSNVKEKHKQLFDRTIDLLIIDESHFGARAQSYGHKIQLAYDDEDNNEVKGLKNVETLKATYKLHLSGTPYRILMGDEFKDPRQIVGKVQFEDILEAKEQWFRDNLDKPEWSNPYYGFPQMVRFGFSLSASAEEKISDLSADGASAQLNELFGTRSTSKDDNGDYRIFKHTDHVLETIKALDGTAESETIFPILNYEPLKSGKMAHHIVMVLPYRASCDAMEKLLTENHSDFINLADYEIINIAGFDNTKTITQVKSEIANAATEGKRTISLTVNKMLTGVTVPQWDSMIYLKGTQSPQEYDQAIYRLQTPFVVDVTDADGKVIGKEDLKPQTLLIDFAPNRMMSIEQYKAFILSASDGGAGNDNVANSLTRQMTVSPIITINNNRLTKVEPSDVLKYIAAYSSEKGIIEEASQITVDLSMLNDNLIKETIVNENEIDSKQGIKFKNTEHGESTTDAEDVNNEEINEENANDSSDDIGNSPAAENAEDGPEKLAKKIRNYYLRILFYAFLSQETNINNLSDVIATYDNNTRLAKHLGLKKSVLEAIKTQLKNPWVRSDLDNKISNANSLLADDSLEPSEKVARAIRSFNRISPSEVFTPKCIAKKMVEYVVNQIFMSNQAINPIRVVDMSSKSGIYLLAMYQKLVDSGLDSNIASKNFFAVTTSTIAYEFTRKVYELMGWNVENIIEPEVATSYDLIKNQEKINAVMVYFNKVTGGNIDMKFDVVVGNPPYQEEVKDTSDLPVYHLFMDAAYKIADRVCLITPARFLFNAGKTPKEWNQKTLNDKHFKVVFYEQDARRIFPNNPFEGGVAVTYRDANVNFGEIGQYSAYPELNSILKKVTQHNTPSINAIINLQCKFDLEMLYNDFPKYRDIIGSGGKEKRLTTSIFDLLDGLFTKEKHFDDDLLILGLLNTRRVKLYIPRKYIKPTIELNKYKVLVPKSNGASGTLSELAARIISTPELGYPSEGFTQSFIGIGAFNFLYEAEAAFKYTKSKFTRLMLGVLKVTQDNSPEKWKYVPLQDFTTQSDIDWTQSIPDIDRQLYAKYGLDEKEIAFIEEKVIAME